MADALGDATFSGGILMGEAATTAAGILTREHGRKQGGVPARRAPFAADAEAG
jgi:hypothetical protein